MSVAPVVIGSAVPSLGLGGMVQALVGLLAVIAAVLACGWLARRFGLQGSRQQGLLKVLGSASLGAREKVVLVEVADTWLVLGVGGGGVRALHTLPARPKSPTEADGDLHGAPYTSGQDGFGSTNSGTSNMADLDQRRAEPPSFQSALIKQLRARLAIRDKE